MTKLSAKQRGNLELLSSDQQEIVLRILDHYPDTLQKGIISDFLNGNMSVELFLRDLIKFEEDYELTRLDIIILKSVDKSDFERRFGQFRKGINIQSGFFRDIAMIKIIREEVVELSKNKKFSIASVGCSNGSEVYSILFDNWQNRSRFCIDGYDSNLKNIEEGEAGIYWVDSGNIQRFSANFSYADKKISWLIGFIRLDNPFLRIDKKVNPEAVVRKVTFGKKVKEGVTFQIHDIFEHPLPKKYDIIVLSNVLMHYNIKSREVILKNIRESMVENGLLVCEGKVYPKGSKDPWLIYDNWMQDIGYLGFQKQGKYCKKYRNVGLENRAQE